jgi:AraC-like DNA-binding protein
MPGFFEKIPLYSKATYIIREYTVAQLDYPKHYHPEYELIYISKGKGKRIVGDNISEFHAGDLVLIGPELPHHWINSDYNKTRTKIRQVITQFHSHLLGSEFTERIECADINDLLKRSSHGISFNQKVALKVGKLLECMLKTNDRFEGLLFLLQILHILSHTSSYKLLSSKTFSNKSPEKPADKIEPIYQYIIDHHTTGFTMKTLADKFCMSISAMSHFIRKKTGKNLTELLLELKINSACKMLVESNVPVSAICFDCGFNNLSYFNRKFKEAKNITPLAFRKLFDHSMVQ